MIGNSPVIRPHRPIPKIVDNRRNYYRILHVQPDAPVEIIKSSYRTLMQRLKHHPDLGGSHWNATLINEAYHVLTDPVLRERYDQERRLIQRTEPSSASTVAGDAPTGRNEAAAGSDPRLVCLFCHAPHHRGAISDPDAGCPNCESPLHPAGASPGTHDGQRAISRIAKDLDIRFCTTWPQAVPCRGRTLDVSPNGMRFITNRYLGEGRHIKITSDIIDAIALIKNCHMEHNDEQWIIGVAFETLRFNRSQGAFFSARA